MGLWPSELEPGAIEIDMVANLRRVEKICLSTRSVFSAHDPCIVSRSRLCESFRSASAKRILLVVDSPRQISLSVSTRDKRCFVDLRMQLKDYPTTNDVM